MKRTIALAAITLTLPAAAAAQTLAGAYNHLYHQARRDHGAKAVGCDLEHGPGKCHTPPTQQRLQHSIAVLNRLEHPTPPPSPTPTSTTTSPTTTNTTPPSGLANCILTAESNHGQTSNNIAQFQPATWNHYAPLAGINATTPTNATPQQQTQVLNYALNHNGANNWIPYEHGRCG